MQDTIEVYDEVTEVRNVIISRLYSGSEQQVNECLHFGVGNGVYAFKSDCDEAISKGYGARYVEGRNPLFVYLHHGCIDELLRYLFDRDGYLAIQ